MTEIEPKEQGLSAIERVFLTIFQNVKEFFSFSIPENPSEYDLFAQSAAHRYRNWTLQELDTNPKKSQKGPGLEPENGNDSPDLRKAA
jgi:hypothetical protein